MTSGYASLDYEFEEYKEIKSKVQVLVNSEPVDALSFMCHVEKAPLRGKFIVKN